MTGRLFIDGNDAFKQWGVYVLEGGWNEAIAYPPLKTPDYNDWQEEDGVEADLSDPVLNLKDFSIKFAYSGLFSRFLTFIDMLSDGAYHEFNCASIARRFTLRMTQMPNLEVAESLGFITIKFSNDFPLKNYTYQPPQSSIAAREDYLLDDVPFSEYGCIILQGSLAEVMKGAAVKENLLRNISTQPGAIYDGDRVTFKTKDVKLNCLMRAKTLEELWRNYDALLFDLIRPDERLLEVTEIEQIFPCHYKSASVKDFFPEDRWLEFSLTLTFTHSFRLDDDDFVLVTEDGIIIETEDGEEAIDLLPNYFMYPTCRFVNTNTTLRLTGRGTLRFNN